MNRAVGEVDDSLKTAITNLGDSSNQLLTEYTNDTVRQHEELTTALNTEMSRLIEKMNEITNRFIQAQDQQSQNLETRLAELPQVVEDMKALPSIQSAINNMAFAAEQQSKRLDS